MAWQKEQANSNADEPVVGFSVQERTRSHYDEDNSARSIDKSLQIKPTESDDFSIAQNFIARANEKKAPSFIKPIEASLPEIARLTILHHFGLDEDDEWKKLSLQELADQFVVQDKYKQNCGLFITLIKNGNTRACWGSINSTHKDLVKATVYTTEDALRKDYRFSPIKKNEINQLIPQVTVVKSIVPINSIRSMSPLKQGLMVRAGGKGAVLLPGEASDPHYQLVKCKLKAGIPSSQPCQLYKIEADVYR